MKREWMEWIKKEEKKGKNKVRIGIDFEEIDVDGRDELGEKKYGVEKKIIGEEMRMMRV